MSNTHEGPCYRCGSLVLLGTGSITRHPSTKKWRLRHANAHEGRGVTCEMAGDPAKLEAYSRKLAKDLEDVVEPGMAAFIAAYRETTSENGDWLDFLVAAEERGVGLIRFLKLDLTNKLVRECAAKTKKEKQDGLG